MTASFSILLLLLAWADASVIVKVDHTFGVELLNDLFGLLVLISQSIVVSQLLLSFCKASHLCLEVLLLQEGLLLIGLHLSVGASALATNFEHVSTGTLLLCNMIRSKIFKIMGR